MGIDYTANYGIGYEVEASEEIPAGDFDDGLGEYLYKETGEGFESFENGSYMTGDMDGVFLIICDPLSKGLDLSDAKAAIDAEMARLKLKPVGEFGLVGGILIS